MWWYINSFTSAHSRGIFEEYCTFNFSSLPSIIQKVEYLFNHYQSLPSGYDYQGPHLLYSEVYIVVGCTPLPVIVKSLQFKCSEGSHGHMLTNDLGNPLMQETLSTTQVVRCFFIIHPSVCIIKSLHAVLKNTVPALVHSLPAVLMNLHFIANAQRWAVVVGLHGQILDHFPQDSNQQNSDLVRDITCSMESMAVKQHGEHLAPDDPVSAELHAWIGATGSTSLIAALNQASANQQACESACSTVLLVSGIDVKGSSDSASITQDLDSEPHSNLGTDFHLKK